LVVRLIIPKSQVPYFQFGMEVKAIRKINKGPGERYVLNGIVRFDPFRLVFESNETLHYVSFSKCI
jgi:hypothetical protein